MTTQNEKWRKFIRYEKVMNIINSKTGIIIGIFLNLFMITLPTVCLIKNIEKTPLLILGCLFMYIMGIYGVLQDINRAIKFRHK